MLQPIVFCIPIFSLKLGLYLVLLQYLCLFYNLPRCVLVLLQSLCLFYNLPRRVLVLLQSLCLFYNLPRCVLFLLQSLYLFYNLPRCVLVLLQSLCLFYNLPRCVLILLQSLCLFYNLPRRVEQGTYVQQRHLSWDLWQTERPREVTTTLSCHSVAYSQLRTARNRALAIDFLHKQLYNKSPVISEI